MSGVGEQPAEERARGRSELIHRFLGVMGFRAWHMVLPVTLGLLTAALDLVSLALLVPLAGGIARGDFSDTWTHPVLRFLLPVRDLLAERGVLNRGTFLLIVGVILLSILLRLAIQYAGSLMAALRKGLYTARARSYTLARFLTFGKLYFDRTSQGKVTRIVEQTGVIAEGLGLAETALTAGLRLGAHLIVLVSISWPLTLITVLVLPLSRRAGEALLQRVRQTSRTAEKLEMGFAGHIFNLLSSLSLVKAHSQENEARAEFDLDAERGRHLALAQARALHAIAPLGEAFLLLALLGMAGVAVAMTATDATTELSSFCAFLLIVRQTMPLLGVLSRTQSAFARREPALDQLLDVFDDEDKCFVASGPRRFDGIRHGIELRNLEFGYYPGKPVLRGISAALPAGRIAAVVGPTGSGKTTLVSLLARLYECPPGSILIDGVDIREFSLSSLHQRLALVSQEVWLFDESIRRNLVYGIDDPPRDDAIRHALKQVCMASFVAGLPKGMETRIGDRGVRLSGGQRQRLSIARALLRKADLVILDEATSSVDGETERSIQAALQEALAGKTVVIVAHRISTIRHADQILVLQDGRFVEQGTWASLVAARGVFHSLWRAQDVGETRGVPFADGAASGN